MRHFRLIGLALIALLGAACTQLTTSETPPATAAAGPTILISIDGFRAEYLDRGVTPTLSKLAAGGARAATRRAADCSAALEATP